jgi:threonine synthase
MPFRPRYTGLIDRYRDRLPVNDDTRLISLGEGNTPLLKLNNIPKLIGKDVDIYVKYEGLNPTGSFKDRGMTMAVTKAVEEGSKAIICASTGNTSAAAAAYAARAGITAFVIIPDGKIAQGKLAQAMMHNAVVIQIKGNFDEGMQLVKDVAEHAPVTIVNSINPYRLQGQKTAAFEIIEELGRAPDYHCLPVGNAGNITAHWIGYCEYSSASGDHVTEACAYCHGNCKYAGGAIVGNRPKMVGYQVLPRFVLVIHKAGIWPGKLKKNRRAGLMNVLMTKYWLLRNYWLKRKGFSANPLPQLQSPAHYVIFNLARFLKAVLLFAH